MTSYSLLLSSSKASIIATWTGEMSDRSANITSLVDPAQADTLAYLLTRLSEHAWSAAAWLGTSPVIEAGIAQLVGRLRSTDGHIAPVELDPVDHRHAREWAHGDVVGLLGDEHSGPVAQLRHELDQGTGTADLGDDATRR